MGRVRIGTCSGPAEVALVRAAFDAHGIHVAINAEHHASVLGGLGGGFVPLHIMVDDADADEAAALLADLRGNDRRGEAVDPEDAAAGAETSEDSDAASDEDGLADDSDVGQRLDRRRRTGIVLLLGLCVTFGTAHMSTGAWFRGIFLAGVQVYAFTLLIAGIPFAWAVLVGGIATDVIGALLRVHRQQAQLPTARVHR